MSETQEIAGLVLKAAANTPSTHLPLGDGRELLIYRTDFSVKDVTHPNAAPVLKPKIVTQAVQVQTVESFVEYVERMKNPDSMIFADIDNSTLHAIVDYHHMPMARATGEVKAASSQLAER